MTWFNLFPAIPEIILLLMSCLAILVTLYSPAKLSGFLTYYVAQFAIIFSFISVLFLYHYIPLYTFSDTYIFDNTAFILKIFILAITFFVFLISRYYIQERDIPMGEYYILGLFCLIGMMVLVSAHNFITIYLGLEILSLPLYAMIAMRRDDPKCSEAAMKYFVMGALASGLLLYGMSMLYGATNSLDIGVVSNTLGKVVINEMFIVVFGLVFMVAGIVFKFGAVPFHMWVPDAYEGAPTSVTLLMGSAPKIAAFALAIRLLSGALGGLHVEWQEFLTIAAVLSMALGNFVAIVQTNIKRMLAYSSIAHMGYLFLGLIAASDSGYAATLFYVISYGIMSTGAFGMIIILSRRGFEVESIEDFRGLNHRSPWLAFMMLLLMFSMAGVPPSVGFFAKMGVLQALIKQGIVWLPALALLFAVIGAYYYLRVVKVMYFDDATDNTPIKVTTDVQVIISITGLAVLLLGLFPGALFTLCHMAL
ncbi:MAG: NADH-quinone oxidoreductase subunit NuoN [Legionellales bacterium]|nr:NADH-quinone oxidoreductase subunit NuoN [Legionellales bacterium]